MKNSWTAHILDICESTQNEAEKFPVFHYVLAKQQTNGRGRNQRVWQSIEGNLLATFNLPLTDKAPLYGFMASLAVAQTLAFLSPRIKWPNDVLIDGKKIAGILLEVRSDKILLGLGLNIVDAPKQNMLYETTCLKDYHAPILPEELAKRILENLDDLYQVLIKRGFRPILQAWLEYSVGLGRKITVHLPNEKICGIFHGLDESGALILKTQNGQTRTITAGDVFMGTKE